MTTHHETSQPLDHIQAWDEAATLQELAQTNAKRRGGEVQPLDYKLNEEIAEKTAASERLVEEMGSDRWHMILAEMNAIQGDLYKLGEDVADVFRTGYQTDPEATVERFVAAMKNIYIQAYQALADKPRVQAAFEGQTELMDRALKLAAEYQVAQFETRHRYAALQQQGGE